MRQRGIVLLLIGVVLIFASWIVDTKTSRPHPHPLLPPTADADTTVSYLDQMTHPPQTPLQKTLGRVIVVGFFSSVFGSVFLLADGIEHFRKKLS
jgi:uncharacterized membrane protein YfcA